MYIPIWKCGNDQIRYYLKHEFRKVKRSQKLPKTTDACVVTAIRDPVEHFLSGYNEIVTVYQTLLLQLLPDLKFPVGSKKHFSQFVMDVVLERLGRNWVWKHIYSMSRILTNHSLTAYLPTIANMTSDWPTFVSEACPHIDPEGSLHGTHMPLDGQHNSSKDPLGSYQAAKDIWKEEGREAQALCALHAMDYACWRNLPNGIPPLCQNLFASPEFQDAIVGTV
jgi:hypothetical protein